MRRMQSRFNTPRCLMLLVFIFTTGVILLNSSLLIANKRRAYATLVITENYVIGAKVLGQSLKDSGTNEPFIVMVSNKISKESRDSLQDLSFRVIVIDVIHNPNKTQIESQFSRWTDTYTKLRAWSLVQFDKVIFFGC